ncbi:MAG: TRAP transporter substrate-binding protein DctP [Thermodesulfobacteriota bacterium]|nr:TRAP transporter substrate-binding protein DctP [Thermodesulfobacteriota bacterium]
MPHHHASKSLLTTVVISFFIFFFSSTSAFAATMSKKEAQQTIRETITALLTGKTIDPALKQEIEAFKKMLEAGTLSREEARGMIKTEMLPVLNEIRTSRYILAALPDVVDKLFSPYLSWEEMRKIAWEAGCTVIKEGEQMILTIGTLAPEGTPWLSVAKTELVSKMDELSDGKVKVKVYGGGIMGEDTDILRKMDVGQLDGCGCTALGVLNACPEMAVFLLPGLFNNYAEVDYIFKKFEKRIDKALEERGYILSAMIDTGFFYFFSKKKITSLDDIRRRKMLTWFGQPETAAYDALDINATPVAVPETLSALSTGLADTNLAPAAWMLGMQAYQYANYYIKQPLLYSPAAIITSLATKERLSRQFNVSPTFSYNIQELLVFEVRLLESYWKKKVRDYERKTLDAFEKKCGMTAVEFSPEDMKAIQAASLRVQQKLAGKLYPQELLDDVLAALEAYRATH